ncbi:DUF3883 domain-containing protein [Treponema sp.]|uniref:DUF3883 domain-containing protein n=1 Tax=Treponema sp. TaxID=166 RepID=UPI0025D6F77F|nr:DUF3883 domain-containing protein [Treponema sp.]MBR4321418.1 DUF3883 domain-containing protein [Treponema sp.]
MTEEQKAEIIDDSNKYIKTLVDEYREDHTKLQERELLIGENNIEKSDIKGYHGREILELLQNADDAYQKSIEEGNKPDKPLEVCITYKDNIFSITNTGTVFDKKGIKAIVQGNISPKKGKYIGNKGTGFRSILNWAKTVKVLSGGFNVIFSKEIANSFFEEIKQEKQIVKQLENNPSLYVPMLAIPKPLENQVYNDSTTIEIEIDETKLNDEFNVIKQLDSIDLRILLFLPNTSKIFITTDDKKITYQRKIITRETDIKALSKIKSDIKPPRKIEIFKKDDAKSEPAVKETFFVFDKVIPERILEDDVKKDILLSVAIPETYEKFTSGHLYTFFPLLDAESPFNCLLHASYDLNSSRNSINPGEKNDIIIKEQLKFIIEIAQFYIKNNDSKTAYKIISPLSATKDSFSFPTVYSKFKLEDFYVDNLIKTKLFYTVNGNLISIQDKPKVFENGCPNFFIGNKFETLLKINSSDEIFTFFAFLIRHSKMDYEYDETELEEIISELSNSWTISQQVQVFIWWNQSNYTNLLPKLLKIKNDDEEENDEFLKINDRCYLLSGDFNNLELPKWVKVPSLRKEYQEELFSQSESLQQIIEQKENSNETDMARLIVQSKIFPDIEFSYRDRSTIISAVNSSVENYEQAIEFVKWLWDNYSEDKEWNPPKRNSDQKIKYNFPDKNNEAEPKDSDFFYFGSDYDNSLADKLFDERYSPIPKIQEFGIDESELEPFKYFLRKFGVKDYPVIETMEIEPLDSFADKFIKLVNKYGDIGYSSYMSYKWQWLYIKNLKELLNSLSEIEIIKWIANDESLYHILSQQYCNLNDVKLEYEGNLQHHYRTYKFEIYDHIDNYILFLFNELPWIKIKDKKYSPKKILQNFKEIRASNKKFNEFVPVITNEKIHQISKELNIDYEKVYNIYSLFSFCNEVTDLPSNDFYKLLLEIPNIKDFTKSEDLSRSIYRILERPENKNFNDSNNRTKFLEEGKLLVNYKGKLQYYPINSKEDEKIYVPSQKILNKKEYPIVEKGLRTNSDNFINLLGCYEYKKEYKIIPRSEEESNLNSDFQLYFNSFREYAKAYSESNSNIAKYINTLSIKIVKSIHVLEKDVGSNTEKETIISEDYSCLRNSPSNWFIVLSKTTSINSEINSLSEIIERIFDNIANTTGFEASKIGELFRVQSREDREFLIKKEFGSLSVIDNDTVRSEIQVSFENTLKKLAPPFTLSEGEIDFDNFYGTDNSQKIINLFTRLKIDIVNFEDLGFPYPIDLAPLYKEIAGDFIQNKKKQFKNILYIHAKTDKSLQIDFVDKVNQFEKYHLVKTKNSVYFNPEEIIIKHFSKIILNWDIEKNPDNIDCEKEYKTNYDLLNPKHEFEDEIANDKNAKRMIYFNCKEEFQLWLEQKRNIKLSSDNKEQDSNNSNEASKKVIPTKRDITYSESKEKSSNSDTDTNSSNDKDSNKGKADTSDKNPSEETDDQNNSDDDDYGESDDASGAFSESEEEKRRKRLKEIGNNGERLIYNYLCDEYGEENVFPKSEAFVTLGILKPGQAESGQYDISYRDHDGIVYFAEVKAGNKHRFFITPGELEFAQKHAGRFKLFIVYNMKKEIPDFTEVPTKFWTNSKFHKKEIIETIEYTF